MNYFNVRRLNGGWIIQDENAEWIVITEEEVKEDFSKWLHSQPRKV